MPYFKDLNGGVHFIENVAFKNVLPSGCVGITDAEANVLKNPQITPTQALSSKMTELDAAYSSSIQQPIAYMGTTFQADADSRALMNEAITGLQAIIAVGGTIPADFAWWDSNNNPVPMTLLELQGLYATGTLAVNNAFKNRQAKKKAARLAGSVANIEAVVW